MQDEDNFKQSQYLISWVCFPCNEGVDSSSMILNKTTHVTLNILTKLEIDMKCDIQPFVKCHYE